MHVVLKVASLSTLERTGSKIVKTVAVETISAEITETTVAAVLDLKIV